MRISDEPEENGNYAILFYKSTGAPSTGFKQPFGAKPAPQFNAPQQSSPTQDTVMNESITRMSALKSSSRIFQGALVHKTNAVEEFKKLTEEIVEYIQKGLWITTEKVFNATKPIQQSEVSE